MTTSDSKSNHELSRRKLLAAAGIGGAAMVTASVFGAGKAAAERADPPFSDHDAAPSFDPVTTPPVAGLHLQFGADASSEMIVSWHTLQSVDRPRVLLGTLEGELRQTVAADETSYTDAQSGQVVYAYHATLSRLDDDKAYMYGALHDGAEPQFGTFRTAPRGRVPFTFTSFGDQGTPTLGKVFVPPAGVTLPSPPFVNDNLGAPAGADTTLGVGGSRLCSICSTAISATPISPPIACAPGGISGRTTAAARATVPGCRLPAIMKTSSVMVRSAIAPIRLISRCRKRLAKRM
jgi:hypothetical protein